MSDERPSTEEGIRAVGGLFQNCGCLIMSLLALVVLGAIVWAVAC